MHLALTSDWSINSFIMVSMRKKYYSWFGQKILTEIKKKFSYITIIKLFPDQSEVSSLPA